MNKDKQAELSAQGIFVARSASFKTGALLNCEPPVQLDGEFNMQGSIGAFSYIRCGGRFARGVRSIGRYCSISSGVIAGDSNHPTDWLSTHPFQYGASNVFRRSTERPDFDFLQVPNDRRGVVIGNDVWIGANAMILPGVSIGDGAVIGAAAVVTRDVPPYAVVAGVPARILRHRFGDATITRLLALRWWRFDADSLLGVDFDDVEACMAQIGARHAARELVEIDRPVVVLSSTELARPTLPGMTPVRRTLAAPPSTWQRLAARFRQLRDRRWRT